MEKSIFNRFSNAQKERALKAKSPESPVDILIESLNVKDHEAFYLLDCRSMEIVFKSKNFKAISGLKNQSIERADTFYHENFSKTSLEGISSNLSKRIQALYETRIWTPDDLHREIIELSNGRKMLKNSYIFLQDASGVVTHTGSFITDITSFVPSGYKQGFTGPNAQKLNIAMMDMSVYEQVLSEREIQILFLLGKGLSSREIGDAIHLSKHTVDTHRRNILKKLETKNSIEAYKKAEDMGLLLHL